MNPSQVQHDSGCNSTRPALANIRQIVFFASYYHHFDRVPGRIGESFAVSIACSPSRHVGNIRSRYPVLKDIGYIDGIVQRDSILGVHQNGFPFDRPGIIDFEP